MVCPQLAPGESAAFLRGGGGGGGAGRDGPSVKAVDEQAVGGTGALLALDP